MSQNRSFYKAIPAWTGQLVTHFFLIHSLLLLVTPLQDLVSLPDPKPSVTLAIVLLTLAASFLAIKKDPQGPVLKKALASAGLFLLVLALRLPVPGVSLGILMVFLAIQALWVQNPRPPPLLSPKHWKWIQAGVLALLCGSVIFKSLACLRSDPSSWAIPDRFLPQAFFRHKHDSLFLLTSLVTGLLAVLFLAHKGPDWQEKQGDKVIRTGLGLALFLGIFGLGTYLFLRVHLLRTPTFDFGLFAQMFENMRKGHGMVTTLERDRLLSHLAVHVSPIYYLMLPFYALFPYPETLQILQVLVVASGLVPLHLICKELGLSKRASLVVAILFMAGPALVGSSFYDLHENCFLPPLVLWAFYGALGQKTLGMMVPVVLTLMVKEDAFIYPVAIGLYALFSGLGKGRDQRLLRTYALVYLLVPVLTFVFLVTWLNIQGTGAMTGRFQNLMAYDMGLVGVILTALQNPGLVLANLFKSAKVYYLLTVLLGLGFLPLMQKEAESLLLLIPLVVMNLLSDYPYQHHLEYQYSYGSFSLLVCMTILSLAETSYGSDIKHRQRALAYVLAFASAFSLTNTALRLHFKAHPLAVMKVNERVMVDETKEALKALPRDQKILAHKLYTTPLADVFDLYDLADHLQGQVDPSVDLVVLPRHGPLFAAEEAVLPSYEAAGYREDPLYSTHAVLVLKKSQ